MKELGYMTRTQLEVPYVEVNERDREQAQQLLGLIALKVKYKRLDLLRRNHRQRQRETIGGEALEILTAQGADDVSTVATWEAQLNNGNLIEGLKQLSPQQQRVMWQLFIEGYSQVEVAQQLDVSPSAVAQIKQRALTQLKQQCNKLT